MNTEQERAEFEESMSFQGEWPQAIERTPDGGYKLAQTASAWEVWQTAWETALQSQVREDEDLKEVLLLALEYWADRQQRYKNRSPVWVQKARDALGIDHARRVEGDGE